MVKSMERVNGKRMLMPSSVIATKVIIAKMRKMVMVSLFGKVVTSIEEIIKMTRDMVMGKCSGQTVQFTKANGEMVFNMAWVKCCFLMAQLRRACLKTIHLKAKIIII